MTPKEAKTLADEISVLIADRTNRDVQMTLFVATLVASNAAFACAFAIKDALVLGHEKSVDRASDAINNNLRESNASKIEYWKETGEYDQVVEQFNRLLANAMESTGNGQ